jgi:ATP-dependent Lhr-like helicase
MRSVGASVVLRNGELVAYLRRNNPNLQIFIPAEEPERSNIARDLAHFLARNGQAEMRKHEADHRGGLLFSTINGQPAHLHWMSRFLLDAGFQAAPLGFNLRRLLISAEQTASPEVQ